MMGSGKAKCVVCAVVTGICLAAYLLFSSATTDVTRWGTASVLSPESRFALPESPNDTLLGSPQPTKAAMWLRSLPVNQRRLQRLQEQCSVHGKDYYMLPRNPRENLEFFMAEDKHKLLHCYIPKVATSTMKRIFSILGNRNHGQSLFNMSGRMVHRKKGAYVKVTKVIKGKMSGVDAGSFIRQYNMVNTFTKTLFVRDPYERLYSAYIDRMFGITENLQGLARNMMLNETKSDSCAFVGLTFRHVVDFMTRAREAKLNEHLATYYSSCFPCHVTYDYIGKMETFRSDVENVLTSLGVDFQEVLGDDEQFEGAHELSVLRDISKRAFEMMGPKYKYLLCFKKYGILKRAWLEFQVRGYLSIKDRFPLSQRAAKTVTSEQFVQLVEQAYLRVKDHEAVRQQRDQARREAFYSLPRPLLHKLQALLQKDCDLFGYDCSVDRRFSESERPKSVFHLDQA